MILPDAIYNRLEASSLDVATRYLETPPTRFEVVESGRKKGEWFMRSIASLGEREFRQLLKCSG